MRTLEQFTETHSQAEWFVYFHNKPVWLVPLDNNYALSVIKPRPEEVAFGTRAILFGVNMEALEQVESARRICDCALN